MKQIIVIAVITFFLLSGCIVRNQKRTQMTQDTAYIDRPAPIENKEDRIEKVIFRFDTPVNLSQSILLWDANLSEIIFKDMSGEKLTYDQNLDEWRVEGFRPPSLRFIVDSISSDYIKDSLKLLLSDLNYVDSTIVDDGTHIEWMIIFRSGKLYEGNYKTATENHAQLVCYLLDLTQKQHSDSLSSIYLLKLRDEIDRSKLNIRWCSKKCAND